MRVAILAFAALLSATCASALEPRDAAYYCTSEFSGGLDYDKTRQRWESTTFNPSIKFVLKLKFLRARTGKEALDKAETLNDYAVTITDAGAKIQSSCTPPDGNFNSPITLARDSFEFRCSRYFISEYLFNLETNRFLEAYVRRRTGRQREYALYGGRHLHQD
jgi:hypothetical protein